MPAFSRLVRFLAKDGKTYYGDAIVPAGVTDLAKIKQAKIIKGDIFGQHQVTDQIADIKQLLAPLARSDVRTVRCLGLNYEKHARESNLPIPKYPVLFYKPLTSLTGPVSPITIPPIAQELPPDAPHSIPSIDYECELIAIIGKEAKNVPVSKALDYVLGYAVGNDVSSREWQLKRGGGQWSLGKGFDNWAPFGPAIVAGKHLPGGDPGKLRIMTKLNGKVMQDGRTDDMIFGVAETVAFLSKGHTLLPGDLIWTGTPSGVGMGQSPQVWLKDGDIIEISLEGVGSITNRVEFLRDEDLSTKPKLSMKEKLRRSMESLDCFGISRRKSSSEGSGSSGKGEPGPTIEVREV